MDLFSTGIGTEVSKEISIFFFLTAIFSKFLLSTNLFFPRFIADEELLIPNCILYVLINVSLSLMMPFLVFVRLHKFNQG